jgi:hypothetical protein
MTKQLLRVGVLVAAMLGVATSGCSGEPSVPGEENSVGTVELPLVAQNGDVLYRLAKAKFTIKGGNLSTPRVITPALNAVVHQETLPTGGYEISLESGWHLERRGPEDSEFKEIPATLTADNPQKFEVKVGIIANVVFSFATSAGVVDLRQGRVNVRISVSDCSSFDSYTAQLATLVVDCLGTIGPDSFYLDQDGYLQRNFKECPNDQTRLRSIDNILGLQYKRDGLPDEVNAQLAYGKDCIADRWAAWREKFDEEAQVVTCPNWKKESEIGTPTAADYDRYARLLPQQFPIPETGQDRPPVVQQMKINSLYSVFWDGEQPSQKCESASNCATLCAAGFSGFVIRQDENNTVLTDPPPWETDTVYARSNPFQRPGFYHPMSFYGPPPGDIFGAHERAISPAPGELCSYFSGGFHYQTTLKENCQVMPTGDLSCVSVCIP